MAGGTGYEPLNVPKPVGADIWVIDGPAIRFYGLPFSTRATVVRLKGGGLWVHSPTRLTDGLRAEIDALGPVRHLIAPNWIHYAYVAEWHRAYPDAIRWAAPGVKERAASRGMDMRFDHVFGPDVAPNWADQIAWMIVPGSKVHREAVFFHHASKTLILTDLIENFEPAKLPWWMALITRAAGIAAPKGRMPPDMKATFDKAELAGAVRQMIGWGPERVILSHGAWFDRDAVQELERAFRGVLAKG
ncbi:DUF4336 domain-containing protein [Shimia biformata]|uniref:DUF4336 domain-containing protein n=1 Tax=Shimia biformata TaxID=1294299 RepID=UPI0019525723|nr:DUF4336 domain-containing protein [Shimia biformata]